MPKNSILSLRLAHHMTQAEFAQALGVSVMTVSRWERGESQPSRVWQRMLDEFKQTKTLPIKPKWGTP